MRENYRALLRTYSGYLRRAGRNEAASIALRMRSRSLRDAIAFVATRDSLTAEQVEHYLASNTQLRLDFRYDWLATLGRVSALQAYQTQDPQQAERDTEFGLACLEVANRRIPKDNVHKQYHRLEVELLMSRGRLRDAVQLISENSFLEDQYFGYLATDVRNPWLSGSNTSYHQWLEGFNRPYRENELEEVECSPPIAAFNNVTTKPVAPVRDGPRVSVIMTVYKPHTEDFLQAVRSILSQSWRNLELIIIDDASPSEFEQILRYAEELDSRVRLVKLPENGGTYRARNVGLKIATGEFITGQDSDDWSHPQRIAMQVDHLTTDPNAIGVVVEAIRVDDHLMRAFPGRLPNRQCEVSLMIRAKAADMLGGYVDARKGADSEFRFRLEIVTDREIEVIPKPLYLTRIGRESLSNADFKPGWSNPVRRAFWNATRYWHRHAEPASLRRVTHHWEPLPVPNRFKVVQPPQPPHFDVVFVCDWRAYHGRQRSLIDSINIHRNAGHAVGVMHLESVLSPSEEKTHLSEKIQSLINERKVREVVPDENATTDLLIVGDPVILQFSPISGITLTSKVTLVLPDIAPSSEGQESNFYEPQMCSQVAQELFQGEVIWASDDPGVHSSLKKYADTISVATHRLPLVFEPENWENERPKLRGSEPIIGRHAQNYEEHWPHQLSTVEKLWPGDGSADVRILGDTRALARKHFAFAKPLDWLIFRDGEIRPEAFMSGIDFFVYFPDPGSPQSFCREALEAAAAGAIVILPEAFSTMHGESAIYAEPSDVLALVARVHEDRTVFLSQTAKQLRSIKLLVENDRYLEFTRSLISRDDYIRTPVMESHANS